MKKERCRVKLEPELEAMAVLWSPEMRRIIARKFRRWARQLEVSARIMIQEASYRPAKRLRRVRPEKALEN